MMRPIILTAAISPIVIITALAPAAALAESTVWTTSLNKSFHYGRVKLDGWTMNPKPKTAHLANPSISVTYHVGTSLLDDDDRVIGSVATGETLPAGSRILLEFVPHHYSHVSWFATGGVYDSPYGDWVAGAASPGGNLCVEKNLYLSQSKVEERSFRLDLYAALATDPPQKTLTVSGPATCTTWSDGVSKACTLTAPGTVNATFDFAATNARFWPATGSKVTITENKTKRVVEGPFCDVYSIYSDRKRTQPAGPIAVPQRSIPFTVSVIEAPAENEPPATPGLAISGDAACEVGTPHTISFSAADPQGDQVRYHIDWDGNGSADQFVPPSGYLPSGMMQAATRTYTTPGPKTVRVRAIDTFGAFSAWASISFSCTGDPLSNTADLLGEDGAPTGDGSGAPTPTLNDLSLRAVPSLVRTGATTRVHWSSQSMSSCTVTGTNGDSWSGLNSPVNGETSGTISSLTTYTLTCRAGGNTFTKTANVNVLPSWVEK